MNEILEITPGIPLMLSSTSKGDAMKWYQPEKKQDMPLMPVF